MKTSWQNILAAWNLAEAGRWDAALEASRHEPKLLDVLQLRKGQVVEGAGLAVLGWQSYYQGRYKEALKAFLEAVDSENGGWLMTWAQLGVAKVASDSGWWSAALDWCATAWLSASKNEHLDLLAQVAGARGEVLLRAGRPLEAAASFAEDLALLGPGNRYAGRVRCYQAHAWSRLGKTGRKAAALAYRLAMHSVGEMGTAAYASAGMALLAARTGNKAQLQTLERDSLQGLPRFWTFIAEARLAGGAINAPMIANAESALPLEYHAERWWLAGWSRALGAEGAAPPKLGNHFPSSIPPAGLGLTTLVEMPGANIEIGNAPWWGETPTEDDSDAWWLIRDCFMP
jgi:tetratricopeptide (TPR) repeat protein